MSEERVKISGYGDPVKVKLTGGRYFFIALSGLIIWMQLTAISIQLAEANNLRERELDIKKEQLELQKRQFQLDSLRFEMQQHKK